jgi:hypothetical protein
MLNLPICACAGCEEDPGLKVDLIVCKEVNELAPLELVGLLGRATTLTDGVLELKVANLLRL